MAGEIAPLIPSFLENLSGIRYSARTVLLKRSAQIRGAIEAVTEGLRFDPMLQKNRHSLDRSGNMNRDDTRGKD